MTQKNLEKIKPKSGGKIQVEQLQAIRLEWFGGICMHVMEDGSQCNHTFDLELAHAEHTPLSMKKNTARSSYERLKDVIEYPERFLLLCVTHHFEFDGKNAVIWYQEYYGNKEIEL